MDGMAQQPPADSGAVAPEPKICLLCEGISPTSRSHCSACGAPLLDVEAVHFPIRRGEEDATNPLLGEVIDGKYRIDGVLGKGGMGTVFRATHRVSLMPVALKILKPRFSQQQQYRGYFLAEAQKAGRVVHDHSARVLDVGESGEGTVFIAMEMVAGVTLHEFIHGSRGLTPPQVVDILEQICDALVAAHQVGLVHRDLSPRNVMVTERDGQPFVKILDFGIAKGASAMGGELRGGGDDLAAFASPPYSAPEHLAGERVDPRADLYSLGVIAFEALTGELPLAGVSRQTTGRELAQATLHAERRPLQAPKGTPGRLVRLIERLLAKDPDDRSASAEQVLHELRSLLRPRGRQFLQTASVVVFAIAVLVFSLAHADRKQPFLDILSGSIHVVAGNQSAPTQVLRSADVTHLRFRYFGFDGEDLEVNLRRMDSDGLPVRLPLNTRVEDGILDLMPTAADQQKMRAELRSQSANGDVELVFAVPGLLPLGKARLRIDDRAPVVQLLVPAESVLSAADDCSLSIKVQDSTALARVQLVCADESNGSVRRFPVDAHDVLQGNPLIPATLLGELQRNAKPVGPFKVHAEAEDLAGNVGRSEPVHVDVDLRLPAVLGPTSSLVTFDQAKAELRLQLSELEPGLQVWVRSPSGEEQLVEAMQEGNSGMLVRLKAGPGGFKDGSYAVRLQDGAGNTQSPYRVRLTFRSAALELRLETDKERLPQHLVQYAAGQLLWDGKPAQLRLRCSKLYVPVGVQLDSSEGRVTHGVVRLTNAGAGRANVMFGASNELGGGLFRLRLLLRREGAPDAQRSHMLKLRVLRKAPVLQLGAAAPQSDRYLFGLLERRRFVRRGDRLQPGEWRFVPAIDPQLLRGTLWSGSSAADLSPSALSWRGAKPDKLTVLADGDRGIALRPGRNLLALDLQDQLGRRIAVQFGDRPATAVKGREAAAQLAKIGDFEHYSVLAEPLGGQAMQLEFEQTTRLVLRTRYRFAGGVRLVLSNTILPRRRPCRPGRLEFDVPFGPMQAAAVVAGVRQANLRLDGVRFEIQPTLQTPAGDVKVKVGVRTVRSNLRPVRLTRLQAGQDAALHKALQGVLMLPVVPRMESFADPVPRSSPGPLQYRPQPRLAVRNLRDFYLQRGEVTRSCYEQVVKAYLALDPQQRCKPERLVFDGDRAGRKRISLAGMQPMGVAVAMSVAGDRPVTGVDFFQVYAWTRMLGWLLARDVELLRLPLGVEMELAAFPDGRGGLHGCAHSSRGRLRIRHREFAVRRPTNRWPPNLVEQRRSGDVVGDFCGLDFGVREWVLDLPWLQKYAGQLRPLISSYDSHLEQAQSFLHNPDLSGLASELWRRGVVRGQAMGEAGDRLSGVVHTLFMPRDGRGVAGVRHDPHLAVVGFRLAAGRRFIDRVRRR